MRAGSAINSGFRHAVEVGLQALLIAAIVALVALMFSAVYKPAGFIAGVADTDARRASIWIMDSSRDSDGSLHYGESVSFGYESSSAESIQLHCFQDGGLVFADSGMVNGSAESFDLGPSMAWSGGDASCEALLGHRAKSGKYVVEAKISFSVAG
jgi:hypothetical protein